MQCRYHPTSNAANTCNQCGSLLCDDCTVDIQGRLFCRSCLADLSKEHPTTHSPVSHSGEKGRNVSWGLLFLFSCFFPPGANYMYMGLIKRGLAAMSGFFLIIFMVSISGRPLTLLFSLAIPVFALTCIFDGFNTRRRINAGEAVPDGVGDVMAALLRNKPLTLIILGVLLFTLAGSILGIAINIIGRAIPLLIFGVIAYVIYSTVKRKPPVE